jgi:hypothetical protein
MRLFKKRTKYVRIPNNKKKLLIDYVINKKIKLCRATELLSIKYSTAKTVMRLYRNQNNIFYKNIEEERNLKMILENRLKESKSRKRDIFIVTKNLNRHQQSKDSKENNLSKTNFKSILSYNE